MKRVMAAAAAALVLAPLSWAQAPGPGQPGAAERRAGPGMMGWRHGMGGWGMMGPGMMGPGMMGNGWNNLDLSQDQRNKIYAIHRELRDKQFALMDRMHESMQSSNFYRGGKFDEQAARGAYATAEKMHRQMFENMLDAQKRVDALLTPQQRQQLGQANQ